MKKEKLLLALGGCGELNEADIDPLSPDMMAGYTRFHRESNANVSRSLPAMSVTGHDLEASTSTLYRNNSKQLQHQFIRYRRGAVGPSEFGLAFSKLSII